MHHSVNMRTIEMYFVFIIFVMGTLLAACSGYELKQFYDDMLELHNVYRRIHGADNLLYNEELLTNADTSEDLDTLSEHDDMLLTDDICYLIYTLDPVRQESAENVFMSWYNQGQGYNYTLEPVGWHAEHFTQIVWKSTEQVCFTMLEKFGKILFIAAYSPPGNQENKYFENVGEPNANDNSHRQ